MIIVGLFAVGGGIYFAMRGDQAGGAGGQSTPTRVPSPAPLPVVQPGRFIVNTIPSVHASSSTAVKSGRLRRQ
jgi:hypothetical protein